MVVVKRGQTAAELQAALSADPTFVANQRARELQAQKFAEEMAAAEAPLVHALSEDGGVRVTSVWDLVNTSARYPQALPILFEHLQKSYPDFIKEGIARALAVPDAISGWPLLLALYRKTREERPNGVKTAIGCALSAAATDDVIDDVILLVRDPEHGESRLVLLDALAASKRTVARKALEKALSDPQLVREAKYQLRRARRKK